jgi:type IV secretory pathway VirB10-like protein
MLYGASKLIVEHLNEGMSYAHVKKVISVSLVFFELGQGEDYVYYGSTSFTGIHKHDTLRLATNQMKTYKAKSIPEAFPEYYIIRINEFDDIAKDTLDEWIYFLKNETLPPNPKAKGLKEAGDILSVMKLSEEQRKAYNAYMENVRYRRSILEGSIGRAMEAEKELAQALEREKEEEAKRKEEEAKRKEEEAKRKEEEAKRKEEEAKRKQAEDKLSTALQKLIKKGIPAEEARELLEMD